MCCVLCAVFPAWAPPATGSDKLWFMADERQGLLTRSERGRLRVLVVFCIGGVLLLFGPTASRRTGIGTLVLFGGALAQMLLRLKRRRSERESASATHVSVPGGVLLRERRTRPLAIGATLVFIGTVFMWAFGTGRTPAVLGGLIVGMGLVSFASSPLVGRRALQFDPASLLVVERTVRFRVFWEEVRGVRTVERYGTSFVAVLVHDPERLVMAGQPRAASGGDGAKLLRRHLARQRAWTGADVWIDAGLFGLDAVLLARAIARYSANPSARSELGVRQIGSSQRLTVGKNGYDGGARFR